MKLRIFLWAVLAVLGLVAVYPVCFLFVGSLMGNDELLANLGPVLSGRDGYVVFAPLPKFPTFRHYVELLLDSPEYFVMFWNSMKITFGTLIGQLLFATPAAFGFAQYEFRFKKALFLLYEILMLLPFQVLMLSDYLVLDSLKLLDNLWGIILPGAFSTFPVFIMYRFFKGIPVSLLESARLDGAGEFQIFVRIGLPLGSSGIISAMVLGFLESFSLIEQPLTFLKDRSLWPLSIFLPEITQQQAGMAFAASVLTFLPALLVFLGGQDYLEQGIISSAVKE